MNTRGARFRFERAERVLCFEPDPTKARVLYDAKIVDVDVGKDDKGRKIPEYLIHFNGWNRSWDRWATEDHVLRDTEENRRLQRTLAKRAVAKMISRKVVDGFGRNLVDRRKKGKKRRCHVPGVDSVLKNLTTESEVNEEEDASLSSDSDDEDGSDDVVDSTDEEEKMSELDVVGNDEEKSKEDMKMKSINIEIPEVLKKQLEEDCFLVNKRKKLVKLPCEPNIARILENYVKQFAINVALASNERPRQPTGVGPLTPGYVQRCTPPEKNVELCKEMVDGLRILFDFTLPVILLYAGEQAQFKKISSSKLLSPSQHRRDTSLGNRLLEDSPPAPVLNLQTSQDGYPEAVGSRARSISEGTPILRRSSRRGPNTTERCSEGASSPQPKRRLLETPPMPRLLLQLDRRVGLVSASSGFSSVFTKEGLPLLEGRKGLELDEVLAWKLLPDGYPRCDQPPPPSCIYGCQHLLRLFVKLPDLLMKMSIPDKNLKALVKHLELFLRFLADYCEELFPEAAYVAANEAYYHSKHLVF
uniref:MSL complex subunit 3 isoform X2 n=1 Tax=Myxine glutinosa TaxID=7769 RepID=UPI00358F1209